jgi:hypothetical protein
VPQDKLGQPETRELFFDADFKRHGADAVSFTAGGAHCAAATGSTLSG